MINYENDQFELVDFIKRQLECYGILIDDDLIHAILDLQTTFLEGKGLLN